MLCQFYLLLNIPPDPLVHILYVMIDSPFIEIKISVTAKVLMLPKLHKLRIVGAHLSHRYHISCLGGPEEWID